MATGIANAIIYVRGVEAFSRPISAGATKAQRSLTELTRDVTRDQAALNASEKSYASALLNTTNIKSRAVIQDQQHFTKQFAYQNKLFDLEDRYGKLVEKNKNLVASYAKILGKQARTDSRLTRLQDTKDTGAYNERWRADNIDTLIGTAKKRHKALVAQSARTLEAIKQSESDITSVLDKQHIVRMGAMNEGKNFERTQQINAETQARLRNRMAVEQETQAQLKLAIAQNQNDIASKQAVEGLNRTRTKLSQMQGQLSAIGLVFTATLSTAIGGAMVGAVKSFTDFDKSLRNIQSIGMQTDSEMQALSSTFRTMSTDLKQTISAPTELAEAFYEVQSAGFYGADAMTILQAATKTATAGLADQTATAKTLAMALHAYGVNTDEATHFTDVMMRAVDIGIFRFEDLTTQMGDFIASAGMMQVPIEEVMAALTAMTKKGIPIAEAATSLNRIMLNYLKPAKAEIELAKQYGIELSSNTLKTKGFAGAMTELLEKTDGNEDVLANLIGEVRGIRGVFALGSDGLKMYNEDLEQLKNSSGTVTRVFDTQTKSLSAQFQNLKNNLMSAGIAIGETIAPAIRIVSSEISKLVSIIGDYDSESRKVVVGIASVAAALGPLLLGAGTVTFLANTFTGLAAAIVGIIPALAPFAPLVAVFLALGAAIVVATTALRAYRDIQKELKAQEYKELVAETTRTYQDQQTAIENLAREIKEFNALKTGEIPGGKKEADLAIKRIENFGEKAIKADKNLRETKIKQFTFELSELSNEIQNVNKQLEGQISSSYGIPVEEVRKNLAAGIKFPEFADLQSQLDALRAKATQTAIQINILRSGISAPFDISGVAGATAELEKQRREVELLAKMKDPLKYGAEFVNPFSSANIPTPTNVKPGTTWDLFGFATNKAKNDLDAFVEKFNELKGEVSNLALEFSEFPLLNTHESLADMDAWIANAEKYKLVSSDMLNVAKKLRAELGAKYENTLGAAFKELNNQNYVGFINAIKAGFMGADASIADFIGGLEGLPAPILNVVKQVLGLNGVIDALQKEAETPIEFRARLISEGFDTIGSQIESLVGYKSTADLVALEKSRNDYINEYVKELQSANFTQREIELKVLDVINSWGKVDRKTIDVADNVGKIATNTKSAADAANDYADAAGKIQGFLSSGVSASKGLGNLLPGGENGILGPGGNGAFESLYRIQDIAMSATRGKGVDTDKWMQMYGLDPAAAAEIVKKFQMGIFDADVMKYVDTNALIDMARLELMAEASQKALAEKLAKESGLGKDVFMGLFGMNTKDAQGNVTLPSIDVSGIQAQIKTSTENLPTDPTIMTNMLSATPDAMTQIAKDSMTQFVNGFNITPQDTTMLNRKGQELWDGIGAGVIQRASTDGRFKDAVYQMVLEAIKRG